MGDFAVGASVSVSVISLHPSPVLIQVSGVNVSVSVISLNPSPVLIQVSGVSVSVSVNTRLKLNCFI